MAKQKPKDGKQQQILIGVGVLLVAIFFLKICKNSNVDRIFPSPSPAPTSSEKPNAQPNRQPSLLESPQFAKNNEKEVIAQQLKFAQLDRLGIKTLPLKAGKNGLELHVEVTPRPVWCQAGDLDVIKRYIDDTKTSNVLITIETPDHALAADPRHVSLLQLFKPIRLSFTLKKVSASTKAELGLYICSDRGKTNKCGTKSPVLPNQQDDYSRKGDAIFYFQQFFVGGGKLTSYKSGEFTESFKKGLTDYLAEQNLPTEVDKAWKTAKVLRSDPVAIKNDRVYVYLSHNDPKCTFDM